MTLVCRATDAQPSTVNTADIVTVVGRLDPQLVSSLRLGTPEKPEHGARLVLACDALFDANELAPSDDDALAESGVSLALSGPGIDGQLRLFVEGVPAEAFERLAAVNAQPSCGIDVHLIEPGGKTVALPRSTRISMIRADSADPALSN